MSSNFFICAYFQKLFPPFACPGNDLGVGVEISSSDIFFDFGSESMMLGRDEAFSLEDDFAGEIPGSFFGDKSATLLVMK